MNKNVASQKVTFLVIDAASNTPMTGDAANLTAYVSIDDGAVTVLGDTSATELSATNAPGLYSFDLTQAETNGDKLVFSGKSSTADVSMIPLLIYTTPPSFSAFVTPTGAAVASVAAVGTSGITRASFAADTGMQSLRSNTAQAGASSSITLDASASAVDDFYNGTAIITTGGTGSGQVRIITDYVGSTKVATVSAAWATNPDNTTTFAIFPSAATAADIASAVLSAAAADPVAANVKEVDDDATAAQNLESYLDGTEFMPVDAHAQDFSVSGTSLTTKKPDGTTDTAYSPKTLTTDAAAEPIIGAS